MYQKKTETDIRCPLEYGLNIFSGKWKSRIICMLGNSSAMRYRDFKEDLVNITDGVLAANLNELISMEIIEKINDADGGSMTEYILTEKGKLLIPILKGICGWSRKYYKEQSDKVMKHCLKCENYQKWKLKK